MTGTVLFGDYLLEKQIAHGGMGVIYRARQVSLDRVVALKLLLLGRYSSPEARRRFRREAQSAAALRHPHIVSVFEVGEAEGQPFLAMEYVEGRSLADALRQGPLPLARSIQYARSVAEAIHYAHTCGVLHRDIKPSNVLLDALDEVRLTDFGLAKKLDGSSDLTMTGEMMGSPNYLSPEQAAGRHGEVGPRTDVYAVGALFFELLTGRPPFMAQTLQDTLLHIRDTEPVAPARLNPAVPADLDTIVLKCLEKTPAKRYASARELADDLGRFLRHEPILARPASTLERTVKWIRRHRTGAALLATVCLSLVAMTAGSLWFSFRVQRARSETEAANRRLERNLFVREWNDAEQLFDEGKTVHALTWFARVNRRDPSNHVVATRLLSLLGDLTVSIPAAAPLVHTGAVTTADFSPDGHRMVTACSDGLVRTWSWRDSLLLQVLPERFAAPVGAAFVPPLDRILVAEQGRVSLWSTQGILDGEQAWEVSGGVRWNMAQDGSRAALITSASEPGLWNPQIPNWLKGLTLGDARARLATMSADGRFILGPIAVTFGETPHIGLWETATGRLVWDVHVLNDDMAGALYSAAISHDNACVAIGRWGGQVLVYDTRIRGEDESHSTPPPEPFFKIQLGEFARAEAFQFLDQNRRLILATFEGTVYLCDLITGQVMPDRIEHSGAVNAALLSPDGATLATASIDGQVRFWDLRPRRSEALTVTLPDEVWDAAFSPDGTWFVTGGNPDAEIRDARTGALLHQLPMEKLISRVAVSPDGRRVVAATEQGTLRIWDSATGAPVTPLIRIADRIHDLSFSSDGRWVCLGAPSLDVRLLDPETGELVLPELTTRAPIVESVITPDQSHLVAGTTLGDVHFWTLPDQTPRSVTGRHRGVVWTAHSSKDSRLVATASGDHSVLIWDVAGAQVLREIRSEKAAYSAVFSPDSRRILIGSADRTARIRDVDTGRQLSETMRHPGGVWFLEYSPDGRLVATGDDAGWARLWDADTGLPVGNWLRSKASLKRLHFSTDGRYLITASRDHTVRVWPVVLAPSPSPGWLPELAEGIAGRRMVDDTIQSVPFEKWRETRDRLAAEPESNADFYSRWARWFLVERLTQHGKDFEPEP